MRRVLGILLVALAASFLTERLGGVTSRLPLRPRSVPFDVDLGPSLPSGAAPGPRRAIAPGFERRQRPPAPS